MTQLIDTGEEPKKTKEAKKENKVKKIPNNVYFFEIKMERLTSRQKYKKNVKVCTKL